jgi:ABC-type transport system substrate-binding protein
VSEVQVDLRRPHVLPQALLQTRLRSGDAAAPLYTVAATSETESRFEPAARGERAEQLRPVIVERYFHEPRKAIDALRKGKVDVLERVLPNDALRMMDDDSLSVGAYAFPSVHVLVPNLNNPFLANRTFRRALAYGINREVILHQGLLNGQDLEGCRVLSAPIPAGISENDPAAYAYNDRITPRPYDPVMAAILMRLAEQQLTVAANQREETAPELGELVLAHSSGELPVFVCKQIQMQLEALEVKCSLRQLPAGQTRDPDEKYDLLFLELAMPEPLVDARRLFGPAGFLPTTNPYVNLALRQVDQAGNWKETSERLHELHQRLHDEVAVVPLWQMIDHFVYHKGLRGLQDHPVDFYQSVDQWRVVPPVTED